MAFNQHELITRAADYFAQARKPREEWKKLDDLAAQLAEFDLRCAAGDYDTAASVLIDIDFEYLNLWGHYRVSINLHETLIEKLNNNLLIIDNLNGLGLAYWSTGQNKKAVAIYEHALSLVQKEGHRTLKSTILGNLGNAYSDLGDTKKAVEYFELALDISKQTKNLRNESYHLTNLGSIYVELGDIHKATVYYEQSLTITRNIGDRRGEGNVLGNLGDVYNALGETSQAINYYEQALKITRDIGDRRGESNHLNSLGNAWRLLNQIEKAINYFLDALSITRDIGYRRGEEQSLFNLGYAYLLMREIEQSNHRFTQSLIISREIGDRRGEASILCGLGNVNINSKLIAIEHYEQALDIACEIKDRQIEIDARNNLGKLFIDLGNKEKAAEHYRKLILILDATEQIQATKSDPRLLRAFLCHSSRDKEKARELHIKLNEHGYDVWIDEKKIMPGQNWEFEIERALELSDVILVCLSSLSVNSESYIHKEIKVALDRAEKMPEGEIFIIPCRLDDVEMPQRLKKFQWVDLYTPDGLDKLKQSLSSKARKLGLAVKQS